VRGAYPEAEIVLAGVSRGAAALINFVSLKKPTHIKAVILESPFDSYDSIISFKLQQAKLNWLPGRDWIGKTVFNQLFPKVNIVGITPLKTISHFPLDIPIILIHGSRDALIPCNCSLNLFKALKERGHPACYYVEIPDNSGKHANILYLADYGDDAYENALHTFNRKHGLQFIAELADKGESFLAQES